MNSDIDFSKLLHYLKPLFPYGKYLVMLTILGVFAFTGWTINNSFNPTSVTADSATNGRVIFNSAAISKVKSLDQVGTNNGVTTLGDSTFNPFGN